MRLRAFCPTGEGGGIDNSCGRGGGLAAGTHVGNLTGDKKEAGRLLSTLPDKSSGKLSRFLERYPVASLKVGKTALRDAEGSYTNATDTVAVRPTVELGEAFASPGEFFDSDYAATFENEEESLVARQSAIFAHELGHHVHSWAEAEGEPRGRNSAAERIDRAFARDSEKVSKYAGADPLEYFAESFAAYHFNPDSLSGTARGMVEAVLEIAAHRLPRTQS